MTTTTTALYIALELSQDKWLLACATAAAEKPRFRPVPARDLDRLDLEIAKAKDRFGLPADTPVFTCFEAGRDGFWLHRALASRGVSNLVVDTSSIEVDRRNKHVRGLIVELAWLWLRFGSQASALTVEMVQAARFGLWQQAGAEDRHRGVGAEALDRVVALPGARGVAGRGRGEGLASDGGLDGVTARHAGAGGGAGLSVVGRGKRDMGDP